jgi:NitT/TauT family transport system substrate-binding protein
MSDKKKVLRVVLAWLVTVTGLHLWLNFDWDSFLNDFRPEAERRLNVAYIPVT